MESCEKKKKLQHETTAYRSALCCVVRAGLQGLLTVFCESVLCFCPLRFMSSNLIVPWKWRSRAAYRSGKWLFNALRHHANVLQPHMSPAVCLRDVSMCIPLYVRSDDDGLWAHAVISSDALQIWVTVNALLFGNCCVIIGKHETDGAQDVNW